MTLIRHGILTRSGWFNYPDGKEYKCPKALKEAVRLTPTVPIVVGHPAGNHIENALDVIGTAYTKWDHEQQAVVARYEFFEDKLADAPELLAHLRQGKQVGVSPGFNTSLQPYRDGHAQTQVLINHVALTDTPRCEVPACGVLDSKLDARSGPMEPISGTKSDEINNSSVYDDVGEYTMPETCIKEKMDKGMTREQAEKECAPKADEAEETTEPDKTVDLEARITVLEEQLARSDALVKALEPMSKALRDALISTKKFTADELKDKNYAELVWLKSKFDSEAPQTVLPPSGLPDTRTLKVEQVGNTRYRYPEKLRSSE